MNPEPVQAHESPSTRHLSITDIAYQLGFSSLSSNAVLNETEP